MKCAGILHFYGDQLWAAGSRDNTLDLDPPCLPCLDKQEHAEQDDSAEQEVEGEVAAVCEGVENLEVSDAQPIAAENVLEEESNIPEASATPEVAEESETRTPAEVFFFRLMRLIKIFKKGDGQPVDCRSPSKLSHNLF